jgi:hypothetical protein
MKKQFDNRILMWTCFPTCEVLLAGENAVNAVQWLGYARDTGGTGVQVG